MADAPPPPPVDDYERTYMGGSAPLARSRLSNPWWFNALLGGTTLLVLASGIGALPQTVVPLALTPLVALLWILFMFLRVSVTASHVHIQYGPFGPKIPIENVRDAKVESYDWAEYGGWGIRRRPGGGYAYSVPGHGGRGVRITYVEKGPRERSVFASSDRPEELVAAIEKAREGVVRVATYREAPGPRIVEEELAEEPSERSADAKRSASRR